VSSDTTNAAVLPTVDAPGTMEIWAALTDLRRMYGSGKGESNAKECERHLNKKRPADRGWLAPGIGAGCSGRNWVLGVLRGMRGEAGR